MEQLLFELTHCVQLLNFVINIVQKSARRSIFKSPFSTEMQGFFMPFISIFLCTTVSELFSSITYSVFLHLLQLHYTALSATLHYISTPLHNNLSPSYDVYEEYVSLLC